MAKFFEGAVKNWKFNLAFIAFSIAFWLLQFFFQLNFNVLKLAFVRSFAFSAATFIALALLSSSVFKFFPKLSRHWPIRRNFGVVGTVFAQLHVLAALNVFFNFSISSALYSLNPFENPVVFGFIANPIILLIALVSTDWAIQKLGSKLWKNIQRLIYIAFWAISFHFLLFLMQNGILFSLPAILLLSITALALAGELFWFAKTLKQRFSIKALAAGTIIILLYLIAAYFAFFAK